VSRLWLWGTAPAADDDDDDTVPCTGLCGGEAGKTCSWVVAHNNSRTRETATGPCPRCSGAGVMSK
jgi:hypothetical protein